MRWHRLLPVALGLGLAGCAGGAGDGARSASITAADAGVQEQAFGASGRRSVKALVYVLHRDRTGAQAEESDRFARELALASPGARVIALTQPDNIVDAESRGFTRERINRLADYIEARSKRYPGVPTVLVGDGGGAALAANLAGLRPKLVDGLVLAACPCMLPEWRKHMEKRMPRGTFKPAANSLDPLMTVGGVRSETKAALLVGANDPITPPKFSRGYAEALALRGIATDFRVLPGKGNDILTDPEVLSATTRMLAALQAPR
jgi:pimeloyl-ACP methyl ester carboxylesterase